MKTRLVGSLLFILTGLTLPAAAHDQMNIKGYATSFGKYGFQIHYQNNRYEKQHHDRAGRCCNRGPHQATREVWVPARKVRVWVPPLYETRVCRGYTRQVCVRDGYYAFERVPGYYEQVPYHGRKHDRKHRRKHRKKQHRHSVYY